MLIYIMFFFSYLIFLIVTIHTAGRMYRQTRNGTRPRLGLEFAHGRACASLLTFFYTHGRPCV